MHRQKVAKEILVRFRLSSDVVRKEALSSFEIDLICEQFPEYSRAYLENLMSDIHIGKLKFRPGWHGRKRI